MASTKTLTTQAKALAPKTKTTCKPQTCPTCGSQECFVRPRYFCGQLLTDQDLDAAQRYVIEKNKLHNRYLVGTGVACGLAVRCDPCDGVVTVEPGYAIDCCGNDIVVCDPQRFDVMQYLKDCFRDDEPGCEGKIITPPPSSCDDLPKVYCLIISYNEIHTRPMTAMTRRNGCATTGCEPSRTNEVFRFDLVEETDDREKSAPDDFWGKAGVCLDVYLTRSRTFFEDLKKANDKQNLNERHAAYKKLFCVLRDDILRLYRKGPRVRCTIERSLREIEEKFPWVTEIPQYNAHVYQGFFRLYGWLLQLMIDCVCDALLVPCTPCGDEGVRLACLTVCGGKIEKICNLARTQLLTGPSLRYWLRPVFDGVHNLVERICCDFELAAAFDNLFQPREETGSFGGASYEATMAGAVEKVAKRGETALQMANEYSPASLRGLRAASFLQLADPNTLTALDVYGLGPEEAKNRLGQFGIQSTVVQAGSEDEAYALSNLFGMVWVLSPQTSVTLVVGPEQTVTAVRSVEGGAGQRVKG